MNLAPGVRGLLLAVLLCLCACSSYQMAYNNLPPLLFAWIEDYVDLSSAQRQQLEPLVVQWHRRHRVEQLPGYRGLLLSIRNGVQSTPLDAALVEQWQSDAEAQWLALRASAVPLVQALLEQLDGSQQRQLLDSLRSEIDTQRETLLEQSAAERAEQRYRIYLERLQRWIGRLDRAQRSDLRRLVQGLPDDDLQWLDYRSLWVDELEQALLSPSAGVPFKQPIQTLILNPGSLHSEALQRLLTNSRQQRRDYLIVLLNGLSPAQRDHLLAELDDLIDVLESLLR